MTSYIGYFLLAESYWTSANHIVDGIESEHIESKFQHPIDFLYAHALELILKGCLLERDPASKVGDYGHRLLKLYEKVKSEELVNDMIGTVERAVKDRWRVHLQRARDALKDKLMRTGLSEEGALEFGAYSNSEIGEALPKLRQQIIWLDKRHRSRGSRFRYLETGHDERPRVSAFALSDDVVWLSSRWACAEMHRHFQDFYASKRREHG